MGWETRKGRRYYYRSRRIGTRVVKEYLGGGAVGEIAALDDVERRSADEAKRQAFRQERQGWERVEAEVSRLCTAIRVVETGALILAGFHQHHRSEWRRRRGKKSRSTD